jgi:hypothetical protein
MFTTGWMKRQPQSPSSADAAKRRQRRPVFEVLEDRTVLSTIFALSTSNQLLTFDSSAPTIILSTTSVTGLKTSESLLGLDFRPATGQLYALGSTSRLYVIDPATGAATAVGSGPFGPQVSSSANYGFNFDPVADRLRVVRGPTGTSTTVTLDDSNLQLNPDTGSTASIDTRPAFATGDLNSGTPNVVASAYTNEFSGAASTTLFGIDTQRDILVRQGDVSGSPATAAGGVLHTIGPLGVNATSAAGFDIRTNDGIAFAELTVGTTPGLYQINLSTGAATLIGTIGNGTATIRAITVKERAVTLFGVINNGTNSQLLRFNSATPGTTQSTTTITGLASGETVHGIDFRPTNGTLYGLVVNGTSARLVTLDPSSGATTQVGTAFTVAGSNFGFNFDPVSDRIHVVSDGGDNLTINPDDGTVTTGTSLAAGTSVVGLAASNDFVGATTTTLFGIDSGTDKVVKLDPAAGTLTDVGLLGVDTSAPIGFDISAVDGTGYAVLDVANIAHLFTIDLTTGAALDVGQVATTFPVAGLAAGLPGRFRFSVASTSANEKDNTALVTITRLGGSDGTVTVNYATANATAVAGVNYQQASGTLRFGPGVTSQTVPISLLDDPHANGLFTANLSLSAPAGAFLDTAQTTSTLNITAAAEGTLQFSSPTYSVSGNGGIATITVNRVGGSAGTVSVDFATTDGTATAGVDYRPVSGTLTFQPGETTKTFTVPILANNTAENNATVQLFLRNPVGNPLIGNGGTATLTITNQAPTSSVSDVTSQFSVRLAPGFHFGRSRVRLRLQNIGSRTVRGPLSLVLENLPAGVRLRSATGATAVFGPAGSPFQNVGLGASNELAAGGSVDLVLVFNHPVKRSILRSILVLAGVGTR